MPIVALLTAPLCTTVMPAVLEQFSTVAALPAATAAPMDSRLSLSSFVVTEMLPAKFRSRTVAPIALPTKPIISLAVLGSAVSFTA